MNLWHRLVGPPEEPRRVANPSVATGIAAAYLVIGVVFASLGAWAWADGDATGGLWRLALGVCFLVLAAVTRRKRQRDGQQRRG